ncbi:MAG TPA: type II toxin-antitoxin system RelE/ParE family toxin [Alphaproteobacteria bacterium]|nr:type II toxin-antitoxin system RelE/ParE family toxin [Alphaproteobacteria bacterium]
MAKFRFSRLAEDDLLGIANYTIQAWGIVQAASYIDDLETCCQQLAGAPGLGRPCDEIRPGLHRIGRGKHVIFYRLRKGEIFVSRILHKRMLPEKHFGKDTDEES